MGPAHQRVGQAHQRAHRRAHREGWVSAERSPDRMQSNKDLIRAMLDFDDEDDEREVSGEFEGNEELERVEEEDEDELRTGGRGPRRCRFLDDEAGVSKRGLEEEDD